MTEHEPIDPNSYERLVKEVGRRLSGDEQDRIYYHIVFSPDHGEEFSAMYGMRPSPKLSARFEEARLSHSVAVLRGEISVIELWSSPVD